MKKLIIGFFVFAFPFWISAQTTPVKLYDDGKVTKRIPLSELNEEDTVEVFGECLGGSYHIGLQLVFDVEGRQPFINWKYNVQMELEARHPGSANAVPHLASGHDQSVVDLYVTNSDQEQVFVSSAMYKESTYDCPSKGAARYFANINQSKNDSIDSLLLKDIYLEIRLYALPEYHADFVDEGLLNPDYLKVEKAVFTELNNTDNKLRLSWDYALGAWEYEAEWLFLHQNEYDDFQSDFIKEHNTAPSIIDFFSESGKDPARVLTNNQHYELIPTFPEGKLFFRVRAVGRHSEGYPNQAVKGQWLYFSSFFETGFGIVNMNKKDNDELVTENTTWQSVTTFAEEGKSKKIVSYYDGSLRSRQVRTELNTQKNILVGESYYDHEGRSTISILPVPDANPDAGLTFNPLVNKFNVKEYDPINYYDNSKNATPQLATTNGAGKYYSSENSTGGIHRDYIPDDRFPYTQVVFENDGTGRVKWQGGVGETFKLRKQDGELVKAGDHVSQFYYTTAAREELIRLFGSNVGEAKHYRKNIVIDPNGQASIAYLDQEGRTIATALIGEAPDNLLDLNYLGSNESINRDLRLVSGTLRRDGLRVSVNTIQKTGNETTNYSFTYDINENKHFIYNKNIDSEGLTEGVNGLTGLNVAQVVNEDETTEDLCLDCEYTLTISITNEKGTEITNQTKVYKGSDPTTTELSFDLTLTEKGTYTITKRLEIAKTDIIALRNKIEQSSVFVALKEQIEEKYKQIAESGDECEPCVLFDNCDDPENEVDPQMDVGPYKTQCELILAESGFDINNINHDLYPFYEQCIKNLEGDIYPKSIAGKEEAVEDWSSAYESLLAMQELLEEAKAPDPIDTHEEHCIYVQTKINLASKAYDLRSLKITNWAQAESEGYLNPLNVNINAYDADYNYLASEEGKDPFFTDSKLSASDGVFFNNMVTSLFNMKIEVNNPFIDDDDNPETPQIVTASIWKLVDYNNPEQFLTNPSTGKNILYDNFASNTSMDQIRWILFNSFYQFAKLKVYSEVMVATDGCDYGELFQDPSAGLPESMDPTDMDVAPQDDLGQPLPDFNQQTEDVLSLVLEKLPEECRSTIDDNEKDDLKDILINYFKYFQPKDQTLCVIDNEAPGCENDDNRVNLFGVIFQNDIDLALSEENPPAPASHLQSFSQALNNYMSCNEEVFFENQAISKLTEILDFLSADCQTIIGEDDPDNTNDNYDQLRNQLKAYFGSYSKEENPYGVIFSDDIGAENPDAQTAPYFLNEFMSKLDGFCTDHGFNFSFVQEQDPFECVEEGEILVPTGFTEIAAHNFANMQYAEVPTNDHFSLIRKSFAFEAWVDIDKPAPKNNGEYHFFPIVRKENGFEYEFGIIYKQREMDLSPCDDFDPDCIPSFNSDPEKTFIYLDYNNRRASLEIENFGFNECNHVAVTGIYDPNGTPAAGNSTRHAVSLNFLVNGNVIGTVPRSVDFEHHEANETEGKFFLHSSTELTTLPDQDEIMSGMLQDVRVWATKDGFTQYNIPIDVLGPRKTDYPDFDNIDIMKGYTNPDYFELLGHWKIDENESNTLKDYSPDGLNADLDAQEFNATLNGTLDWQSSSCIRTIQYTTESVCLKYAGDQPGGAFNGGDYGFSFGNIEANDIKGLCQKFQSNIATEQANQEIEDLLNKLVKKIDNSHRRFCVNMDEDLVAEFLEITGRDHYLFTERFRYEYTPKEYHYTLYYYDQAGSLLQTVPPEGVRPLSKVEIAQFLNNGIAIDQKPQPKHKMITHYRYNSLGQLVWQSTPDGGESNFWYDEIGRLKLSQNAQQKIDGFYSYTKWDALGRTIEVGQLEGYKGGAKWPEKDKEVEDYQQLISSQDFPKEETFILDQRTITHYDDVETLPHLHEGNDGFVQENLRGRVAWTEVIDNKYALRVKANDPNSAVVANAVLYDYDIYGNVKQMMLASQKNRKTVYDYDLLSGNVHHVVFSGAENTDLFIHRYKYDADNRITTVETSVDGYIWHQDARYLYYANGWIARLELGEYKVQGLDYYYTIQGWIKGVNAAGMDEERDLGRDGFEKEPRYRYTSKDVFGYSLGYYEGDYQNIGNRTNPQGNASWGNLNSALLGDGTGLYNGNISWMNTDLKHFEEQSSQLMVYQYDQLSRIRQTQSFKQKNNAWVSNAESFKTSYNYDSNGNIMNLTRHNGAGKKIDDMTYHYKQNENGERINQLDHVHDWTGINKEAIYDWDNRKWNNFTAPDPNHTGTLSDKDFKSQSDGNYTYDAIGNLIADKSEGILNIGWTISGKVKKVTKDDGSEVIYHYDATGNRLVKRVRKPGKAEAITLYYRDGSGNVMQTHREYEDEEKNEIVFDKEFSIYGSNRLGMYRFRENLTGEKLKGNANGQLSLGHRSYELSNHLSNVLTVITDNKLMTTGEQDAVLTGKDGLISFFKAKVVSASDYYPFGLSMEERKFENEEYRYGFNGKENDKDFGNKQVIQDYGFRIYNPSIAKFLSVDPLAPSYPWNSVYAFAEGDVIRSVDLDGLERHPVTYLPGWVRFIGDMYLETEKSVKAKVNLVGTAVSGIGNAYYITYQVISGVKSSEIKTISAITTNGVTEWNSSQHVKTMDVSFQQFAEDQIIDGTTGLAGDLATPAVKTLWKKISKSELAEKSIGKRVIDFDDEFAGLDYYIDDDGFTVFKKRRTDADKIVEFEETVKGMQSNSEVEGVNVLFGMRDPAIAVGRKYPIEKGTINIHAHGSPNFDGIAIYATDGSKIYVSSERVAKYLSKKFPNHDTIKLYTCYGGNCTARTIANRTGKQTMGYTEVITVDLLKGTQWTQNPKEAVKYFKPKK